MSRIQASIDTTLTFRSQVFPEPGYGPSIFVSHKLSPHDFRHAEPRQIQPDWIPGILLLCFFLLAWVQVFFHKRVTQVFRAPFSQRFVNQLIRDGNLFQERISVALAIVYILVLGLYLYQFNEWVLHLVIPGISGFAFYGLILLAVVLVPVLKAGVIQFLGSIFKTKETTYGYLLNHFVIALISGPLLLAGLVFIIYLKSVTLLYAFLGILALLFVFRFLRGLVVGLALTKFSYLFLFVYLCTLEILPLVVLLKLVFIRM